jgi:hypothetical protein
MVFLKHGVNLQAPVNPLRPIRIDQHQIADNHHQREIRDVHHQPDADMQQHTSN